MSCVCMFLLGASTGTLLSTRNDRDGGQCLEGLKMVVSVLPREEGIVRVTDCNIDRQSKLTHIHCELDSYVCN